MERSAMNSSLSAKGGCGNSITRRELIQVGSAAVLGLAAGGPISRFIGTPVGSSCGADPLSLSPDEVRFLRSDWMPEWYCQQPGWKRLFETEARRLVRVHGARLAQLQLLASAAAIDMQHRPPPAQPVRWPWKSRREFHQRLQEAHVHYRRSHPATKASPVENLRYVGFRPDEVRFLLYWHQEYQDWCFSPEGDKKCRYYPTCKLARQSLPSLDVHTLIDFSLALCDELGLDGFVVAALPLKEARPSIPWKTIDEIYTRLRDVDAYELRKAKAENTSGTWWPRVPLDFSRQELAFLDAWFQERLHRKPGPAHGEQTARRVWDAQLVNLVWASHMEIEPRPVMTAPWPWHSREEFSERLRSAATWLYKRARFRPKPTTPFRPEEDRFIVAWIQEDQREHFIRRPNEAWPLLDVIKAHAPEMVDGTWLHRSEWEKLKTIDEAWLKVKGLHVLAVAGGPPPEGPIVYPWKDRAEFEARVRDAARITHDLDEAELPRT